MTPTYYSQKDKEYGARKLPKSNLTMRNYGCYVTCIAMLGQVHPTKLLIDQNFADGGLLYSARVAKTAGIVYRNVSFTPLLKGWCVGVTDHYKASGFQTHFFLVHAGEGLQIDPLDLNPSPEPLVYKCYQYRIFDDVPLMTINTEEDDRIKSAINLNSQSWHLLHQAQKNLNNANNLLRSIS